MTRQFSKSKRVTVQNMAKRSRKSIVAAGLMLFSGGLAGCALAPEPLAPSEIQAFAAHQIVAMTANQERVGRTITLHEAMARALKYNLDARVAAFEESLRVEESRLASMDMLPRLVASGSATSRDSISSSSSRSIQTGRESLEPSTSQDRSNVSGDLIFSYNILDFGLSYLRAQQSADRALIALEHRRKVANRLLEDVRTAYWRAIASQKLASRIPAMEARIASVQRANQSLRRIGQTSPIATLTFEREVIDLQREIRKQETELSSARAHLASLMNINPGEAFALAVPSRNRHLPALPADAQRLAQAALENRAEIRELMLQKRITATEAKVAVVEMLPGIQAFVGGNVDSNSFLTKSNWVGWGARASWNLINILRYPQRAAVVDAQDRVLDQKAMAAAMTVVTQVYVGRARFYHAHREYHANARYEAVQNQLLSQVAAEARAGKVSEQTVLREEMNRLIATVRADLAYAAWNNAYASAYAAIGVDPFEGSLNTELSVQDLSRAIAASRFERGGKLPMTVLASR
jgi:outer membrane protein TolC